MTGEAGKEGISPALRLGGEVRQLDRKIFDCFKDKRYSDIRALESRKNDLLLEALGVRRGGDRGIRVVMRGDQQEELHPHSGNTVEILFEGVRGGRPYMSVTNLPGLRRNYSGDLYSLIGEPNGWASERGYTKVKRYITEINTIDPAIQRAQESVDPEELRRLNRLKVLIAERVLAIHPREFLGKGRLYVVKEERGLIGIRWAPLPGKLIGFRLVPQLHFPLSDTLEEAVRARL